MTLQKLVANVRERFRATTSKSGSTLTLLTKNIIYSIGKLLTISSRDVDFTNQDKTLQKMVCINIKFYLWKQILKNYSEGDLAIVHATTRLICQVAFLKLSSAKFCLHIHFADSLTTSVSPIINRFECALSRKHFQRSVNFAQLIRGSKEGKDTCKRPLDNLRLVKLIAQ